MQLAQQIWTLHHIANTFEVITLAASLTTILLLHLQPGRQITVAGSEITETDLIKAFHSIVNIFLSHTIYFPKHMVTSYIDPLPPKIYKCQTKTINLSATVNLEARSKLRPNLQGSDTLKHINTLDVVATINYKPNKSRTARTAHSITVCFADSKRLTQNEVNQIPLPEKNRKYRKYFHIKLFKFSSMRNGQLGPVTAAKQRFGQTELIPPAVHSASYLT